MAVPTYDRFIEPILRFLAGRPDGAPAREVHEAVAAVLGISDDERQELLSSGSQPVYKNRAGWAHDRLKRAGLSASPRRGWWRLTDQGHDYARTHAASLTDDEIDQLAKDFVGVRLRPATVDSPTPALPLPDTALVLEPVPLSIVAETVASPDDRLEQAVAELRGAVAAELLETLASVSSSFFETIVLDLLHRMGYGTRRTDLRQVGGAGDGGIDGVISLDKLGLEKVYVQAKRWQGTVGRPEIQGFYGALAGQRANKGVFITTSDYTAQARDFARSVERIVLVDGRQLVELMMEHEVGVTARTVRIPKIDSDYFE